MIDIRKQLTMKESVTRHVVRMGKICSKKSPHLEGEDFEDIAYHCIEILKDMGMEENPHTELMAFIEKVLK